MSTSKRNYLKMFITCVGVPDRYSNRLEFCYLYIHLLGFHRSWFLGVSKQIMLPVAYTTLTSSCGVEVKGRHTKTAPLLGIDKF